MVKILKTHHKIAWFQPKIGDFEETIVDVAKRVKLEINQQLENQEPFMIKELIKVAQEKDFHAPENNHIGKSVICGQNSVSVPNYDRIQMRL